MSRVVRPSRSYSQLSRLQTFDERFEYLRLDGGVGETTFGFDRWINQTFYRSHEWKSVREYVIVRDNGCDLGISDREIHEHILIHHMNPMSIDDIVHGADWILDPEYLITTTQRTHNGIHYGRKPKGPPVVSTRQPNDTKLW